MQTIKLSELNKGDLFRFPSQKEICIFDSDYDDVMSGVFKYKDGMGFDMQHQEDILVILK